MGTNLPPQSAEAEEAVIGAMLIDPGAYYEVSQVIQASDFYIHRHRFIWEAITHLHERGVPIDFLTLTEALERAGWLNEVGGTAYLTGLITKVPTSLHALAYAQIIKDLSVRRHVIDAASQVAKLAMQDGKDLDALLHELERAFISINNQSSILRIRSFSDVLGTICAKEPGHHDQRGMSGVRVGFHGLDRLVQGLQPADLVVIAGRPGMGKTSLLLSIIKNVAVDDKKNIAIFTMEMSSEQVAYRLLAQTAGIELARIRSDHLSPTERSQVAKAIDGLRSVHLFLDDTPSINMNQIHSACRKLSSEHGLDLVVVDYLQLLTSGERFENRVQEVSFITRQLKSLARELNVPVLAAAQLSRAVELRADKHPLLSDLRESGSIEMDADIVMFIYSPDEIGSI